MNCLFFLGINIRRDFLLEDSIQGFEVPVYNFKIKFIGEIGIDAGIFLLEI